jgi:penicillin-binding protein 1A
MRKALEQSVNVIAVAVQLNIGNDKSVKFIENCGITTLVKEGSDNDLNPSALALGGMTYGTTTLEMAAAYSAFVNSGIYTDPIGYTKVTDREGKTILDGKADQKQAMNAGTAFIVNDMLRTTVTSGLASNANISGVPVAGKTGTTSNYFDAWFVGSTPKYSGSIWIGNDFNAELVEGSSIAAAIWGRIVGKWLEGSDPGAFAGPPANVTMASVGGLSDYVITGTAPTRIAAIGKVKKTICTESGFLATPWCTKTESKEYEAEDVPTFYCNLHNLNPGQYPIDPNTSLDTTFNPNKSDEPKVVDPPVVTPPPVTPPEEPPESTSGAIGGGEAVLVQRFSISWLYMVSRGMFSWIS